MQGPLGRWVAGPSALSPALARVDALPAGPRQTRAVAMQTSQVGPASALWAWLQWPLAQAIHVAVGRLLQAASLPAGSCPLSPQPLTPAPPP